MNKIEYMYKKIVLWCRAHKMYSTLEILVRIEHILRFRLSEKMLDTWFANVGKYLPGVKSEMRTLQYKPDWYKLSIDDKRTVYCAEKYY